MLVHRNKVKIMDKNENVIINQVWFELYLSEIYYFPFAFFSNEIVSNLKVNQVDLDSLDLVNLNEKVKGKRMSKICKC